MNASSTDRIEKQVLVRASHENVWHTLTDSEAFGNWFGAKLDGEFATGARVRGPLTIEGMEHLTLDIGHYHRENGTQTSIFLALASRRDGSRF